MLRARARWAQAEDVNNVVWLRETVLCGNIFCPLLHLIRLNFDGRAALTTDQMVMVRVRRARAKQALAILLQRISVTSSSEVCQGAIDSGKTDRATGVAKRTVQRLSAHKAL
tara:strand:- start:5 stop:340 length:336 start_codon:yes stop_codon:yes gene_type:complete